MIVPIFALFLRLVAFFDQKIWWLIRLVVYLPRSSEKWTIYIEESYKALTRLRTWKILSIRVKSLKAVPPAVAYILLTPFLELAHIYTCRCELISFLLIQVFQDLQTKDVEKAHPLCVYDCT